MIHKRRSLHTIKNFIEAEFLQLNISNIRREALVYFSKSILAPAMGFMAPHFILLKM